MPGIGILDEDKDLRKLYECPRCNRHWTDEGCEEDCFEFNPSDKEDAKVLNIDDGKEIKYRKYPEKRCPDCSDKIMDGRLKGPYTEVNSMVEAKDFECQVCGGEDFDTKPAQPTFYYNGDPIAICNSCNTYHFIYFEWVAGVPNIVCCGYREDLQTRRFNESFLECIDILRSKGTPIKEEDGGEEMRC